MVKFTLYYRPKVILHT